MDYYLERLENELRRILGFWMQNVLSPDSNTLYAECNNEGVPNKDVLTGSVYLGRVLYGASAACRFLNTVEYKVIADTAFKELYERFKNPAGGFYWAISHDKKIIHDSDSINMAQAFVLYGLSEYALLTKNPIIEAELKKQYNFITTTAREQKYGGYADGFNQDWKPEEKMTKSLRTHIHLLEAYSKYYEFSKNDELITPIKELIDIVQSKFIDHQRLNCIQTLTTNWSILPGVTLAGHNAEISWILCSAAHTIDDADLEQYCCSTASKMTKEVFNVAFDKAYGGVFNDLADGKPTESFKTWWPQAEAAIAALNAFQCTKDKYFLSCAIRLVEYIENTFSDAINGEWYCSVSREGIPLTDEPKINFWKSLYHNVRYVIEISTRLRSIING